VARLTSGGTRSERPIRCVRRIPFDDPVRFGGHDKCAPPILSLGGTCLSGPLNQIGSFIPLAWATAEAKSTQIRRRFFCHTFLDRRRCMPIYEYRCPKCNQQFEQLVRGDETVTCPKCGSPNLTKLLSRPAVSVKQSGTQDVPPCGNPNACCSGNCQFPG
jgi:putative FmdB family regulatory protein